MNGTKKSNFNDPLQFTSENPFKMSDSDIRKINPHQF